MPQYGLKGVKIGKYTAGDSSVNYSDQQEVGKAMKANFELRRSEARLYGDDALAEYMTGLTGGTISLGVTYIKDDAQKLMFGFTQKSNNITPSSGTTTTVQGLAAGAKDTPSYVGVAFFCPALKDNEQVFWCCHLYKVMFGPPSMSLQTKSENIQFNTPTTNGEILPADTYDAPFYEFAYVDSEDKAYAWVDSVLFIT